MSALTHAVPAIEITPGVSVPQVGLGTYRIDDVGVVNDALDVGYRLFDLAASYGNEAQFGAALVAARVPRCEVFVTTKVASEDHGRDATLRAFDASSKALRLDVVDLYLVHWPSPARNRYVETWQALEKLEDDCRVRAIGVSNFEPEHLDVLRRTGCRTPAVNQVELHPYFQQPRLRALHAELGVVTQAWSPLGRGAVLEDPVLADLAAQHRVTPAQVVLRWHAQLGHLVVPKASNRRRLAENLDVFGFVLSAADMARIETLDRGIRRGPDPARS